MAPLAQHGGADDNVPSTTTIISTITPPVATSISYNTKGSTPTPVSSIATIPSSLSTAIVTPTYLSNGQPTSTTTSLRGSQPPSKMAIQGTTLGFILMLTLLLGTSLGVLAYKKGWGYRNTVVAPAQQTKPPMLQRQDSNATLVDESSLRRHRRERTVTVETSELNLETDGSANHGERSTVEVPQKAFRAGPS